jgi:RimJ/RimL family protein N-acetyltransferase
MQVKQATKKDGLNLEGRHVRLEILEPSHSDGLAAAAAADPSLYRWSPVPQGKGEAEQYIETALNWHAAGTALPFAIVRATDDVVIGSTRFFNIERWAWPVGHRFEDRETPDACEIGYTWLGASAVRTAANTEAKFLMLSHAFESWQVFRVCFHTDARNQRSQAALRRLGAQSEGMLRAHRMASDFIPRDSVRFSIITSEWPEVKQRLLGLLKRE